VRGARGKETSVFLPIQWRFMLSDEDCDRDFLEGLSREIAFHPLDSLPAEGPGPVAGAMGVRC